MARAVRLRRLVPGVVLTVALSVLTAYAVLATGHKVQKLDLNNSGIWATNDRQEQFGRLLKSASALDVFVDRGKDVQAGRLDVLQDGNAVLAQVEGTMVPIDTAEGQLQTSGTVIRSGVQVELRGGTLAALDPASGKVWGTRIDRSAPTVDLGGIAADAKPLADLGAAPSGSAPARSAALSLGTDGTIHAVSASGRTVRILADGSGFAAPENGTLAGARLTSVQVAALGPRSVVFDADSGTLFLPDGRTQAVPNAGSNALLQQGGPDAETVLVATATSLVSVALADGGVQTLFERQSRTPVQPVQLKLGKAVTDPWCGYAAWFGDTSEAVMACSGREPELHRLEKDDRQPLVDPVFRINWNQAILNDRTDGWIYDVDLGQPVAWPKLKDKNQDDQDQEQESSKPDDAKPTANPDPYFARPGRTSILHVLDNDSDPGGNILSITQVSKPNGGATAEISPDGQTIRFHQPPNGGDTQFTYTVSNGRRTDEGAVTMTARTMDEGNSEPHRREGYEKDPPVFAVRSGGTVTMPVLADWRDDDGDPIILRSADGGEVSVTADGQIEYTAETTARSKSQWVTYQVTDGRSAAPQEEKIGVSVVGDDAESVPPVAEADAVRGEAGRRITILPLANDLPGVDLRSTDPRLTVAEDVRVPGFATQCGASRDNCIETDKAAGRVDLIAKKPGFYDLDYTARFGTQTAKSKIRVVVVDQGDRRPIAMPDQAVMRGQAPVMVDVLANDADPAGGLLTVQKADPLDPAQVEVAVVKGRWVWINPKSEQLKSGSQVVRYTVTNGQDAVEGDLTITQVDAVANESPLVRGDKAVVRAGDSVLIPVLANDSSLGGSTLFLATDYKDQDVPDGRLPVIDESIAGGADQGDVGKAYATGDYVRYVAPSGVDAERNFVVTYEADCVDCMSRTSGRIEVTVKPEPTEQAKNSPPEPQSIEVRAVSGDTITIPVPSSGQDPDGDSVSLIGIDSAPKLGRVLGISPKGITYQAYPTPDSVGTDSFSFTVADRYGEQGVGHVRVAVVPPGQTQPPVALDDTIVAKPGARITVSALANDLIAQSDQVSIRDLAETNSKVPGGAELIPPRGPVTVTAPAAEAEPLSLDYGLVGNGGTGNTATITIKAEPGRLIPPRLYDEVAELAGDGKTATVDVLAKAWDPDGEAASLQVTGVTGAKATIVGGKITVATLPRPQVLVYEVQDADGAQASALAFVPAGGDGLPYVKGPITIGKNDKQTFALADYVGSPRGRAVWKFPEGKPASSPVKDLDVTATRDSISLETKNDYVGPASISLTVTDGADVNDADARKGVVTIPIQVGPQTPVLRCPEEPQVVKTGTRGKSLDLATLCHVWTPKPEDVATLSFSATWGTPIDQVSFDITSDPRKVALQATVNAKPDGPEGVLMIGIPGTEAKLSPLKVVVKDSPRPKLKPIIRRDVKAGTTVSGEIKLDTEVVDGRQDTIVSLDAKAGSKDKARVEIDGRIWRITPNQGVWGALDFTLRFSDTDDLARTNRQGTTTLTVMVYEKPAKPRPPQPGRSVQSKTVSLTWPKPDPRGAPILEYRISQEGGGSWPTKARSYTVKGLPNGEKVRFRVEARNKADWSEPSEWSVWAEPNQVPSTVTGFTASNPRDGQITLSWNAVVGDFTPVDSYLVAAGNGAETKVAGRTTKTLYGLANKQTTFTIRAHNKLGKSKAAATTVGWPSGPPGRPAITSASANLDTDTTSVKLAWSAADPNGEGPVRYSVTRDGTALGGCQDITATSCTDGGVTLNGDKHTYKVTATNKPAVYTTSSAAFPYVAEGKPEAPGKPSVAATGTDRGADVNGTVGNSRGADGFVRVFSDGSLKDTKSVPSTGGSYVFKGLDVGANGDSHQITVELCHTKASGGNECTPGTGSASVTPFGDLARPSISSGHNDTQVWASATGNGNGRDATLTITSSDGKSVSSAPGSGAMSVEMPAYFVDYEHTTTFTVTLTTSSTSPGRPNAQSNEAKATTPSRPAPTRTVSVFQASSSYSGSNCSKSVVCPYVGIRTSGFTGSYSCELWTNNGGDQRWYTKGPYSGDIDLPTDAYFGFWDKQVWAVCDSVSSARVTWVKP